MSDKKIDDLKEDPANARTHDDRNVRVIADSLRSFGAARSIVIDENDQVIAGAGTLKGAKLAGITDVQVVEADGKSIIAVRRRNLSDEDKRLLALVDNRAGELADWNPDVLRQLAGAHDLSSLFTPEELDALINTDEPERIAPIKIERPTEVAWILLAVPLEKWPTAQPAVERLQAEDCAVFSTMVLRGKDAAPLKGEPL